MRVERLARHDQVHHLRRTLEDAVDARVAQRHLDAGRTLAALVQRLRALVAAAAAHLHVVVVHLPQRLGTVVLGRRRLEPDVGVLVVRECAGDGRPWPSSRTAAPCSSRSSSRRPGACRPAGPTAGASMVHQRASSTSAMPPPIAAAGMPRRPTLSVASAIFRPSPGLPIRFSAGTLTSLNVTTPFAMPRRPMKRERRTRSTPGQAVSTTKQEICGN